MSKQKIRLMENVIVLQLTPVEEKDVYLLVSGSKVIISDTSML